MRIEKRLPFGFRGDWGKLYKRYTAGEEVEIKEDDFVEYEKNYYVDIGEDVQFKRIGDITEEEEDTAKGLIGSKTKHTTVETTDAYWDNDRKEYMCVISPDDLIKVFGRLWIVTSIKTVSRYSPAEHKFFYCDVKSIL